MKFICDMVLFKLIWGEKRISATPLPKFWEKIGEIREIWCDRCRRENKEFQQWYCQKLKKKNLNCGNWIAKIGGLKRKKKNCSKSNAMATHYFTIFFTNCCYSQFLTGSH